MYKRRVYNKLRTLLYWEIQASGYGGGATTTPPDKVIAVILKDGREVFVHTHKQRTLQRACHLTLLPRLEQEFLNGSHAYRRGRSHYTAMAQARLFVRQGYHYATSCDIRKFYPSIRLGLLEDVLIDGFPWIHQDLRDLLLWTCCPYVIYRPSHPARKGRAWPLVTDHPGHLLPGSIVGPMLANMVAHTLVDLPMVKLMPSVVLIRFADDMLILAQTPGEAEEARVLIGELLAMPKHELRLHPDKGHSIAVDIRRDPLLHLGKLLHGGQVVTPDAAIENHINRIVTSSIGSWEFRSAVGTAIADLCLDRRARLDHLRRLLRRRSRVHGRWFDQIGQTDKNQPNSDDPEDLHTQAVRTIENDDEHRNGVAAKSPNEEGESDEGSEKTKG
ncbi:MAG: hypothetical protein GY811_05240 [Myxococcales bacterium]|nr:hypothetical protein [Myxococcales bacterium]